MKYLCNWFFFYILKFIIFIISKIRNIRRNPIKGILILSYFNLGDLICDTPSFRSIRKKYLDHKIVCLVRSLPHKELMDQCPYVNETMIIYSESKNSIFYYINQLRLLSRINFVASFQLVRHYGQLRRSAIPFILGIKYRYGLWSKSRPEFAKCYSHPVVTINNRSRTDESLLVVESAGIPILNRDTECWYASKDIFSLSKKINISLDKCIIIIHLGGTDPMKCWKVENYANVANRLQEKYACQFILTGVEDEHDKIHSFMKSANLSDVIDLCGKLTIFELFALISQSNLVITNDTGPMHFSIALKKNIVAIFGPTPPSYAIGKENRPLLRVVRGDICCINKKECEIYMDYINRNLNDIHSICNSKYMVCIDKVRSEQVYNQCVALMEAIT